MSSESYTPKPIKRTFYDINDDKEDDNVNYLKKNNKINNKNEYISISIDDVRVFENNKVFIQYYITKEQVINDIEYYTHYMDKKKIKKNNKDEAYLQFLKQLLNK